MLVAISALLLLPSAAFLLSRHVLVEESREFLIHRELVRDVVHLGVYWVTYRTNET